MPQGPSRLRRLLIWSVRIVGAWVALSLLIIGALRFIDPPTSAFMLERRWEARDEKKPLIIHYHWVPLRSISPELQRAVIAAEDQKFPSHHGFDFDSISAALDDRLEHRGSRGASTLTQQVAKNLFLWPARSFIRKGIEAYLTGLIELLWPKKRILEMHLNLAEYADGVYGADAAARLLFHKAPGALSAVEASQLATVLPAPRRRNATALTPAMTARAAQIAERAAALDPDPLTLINGK